MTSACYATRRMVHGPPPSALPPGQLAPEAAPPPPARGGIKAFFVRYGKMLWWFHSFYALGLGIFIIIFAQKGFAHARWLSISLAGAWVVLILIFRPKGLLGTRED